MDKLSDQVAAIADIIPHSAIMWTRSHLTQIRFKWGQVVAQIPMSDRREAVTSELDSEDPNRMNLRDYLIRLSIWLEGFEAGDASARATYWGR